MQETKKLSNNPDMIEQNNFSDRPNLIFGHKGITSIYFLPNTNILEAERQHESSKRNLLKIVAGIGFAIIVGALAYIASIQKIDSNYNPSANYQTNK